MAWECRQLAAATHDHTAQFDLLEMAEQFERLAQMHEWEVLEPKIPVRSNQDA